MVQPVPSSSAVRDANATRRHILAAASDVFRERGFHAAGMREIAASLGIAVGKLYYYFDSKQALLAYCQRECLARLLAVAHRVLVLESHAAVRLHLIVLGHLRALNESIPGSLAHLEVESLREEDREAIVAMRDRYEALVRDVIAEGARGGVFTTQDPALAARLVLGALNWTVKWYRPTGGMPLHRIEAVFAEQLVRGVLADGHRFTAPLATDERLAVVLADVEAELARVQRT